MKGLRCACVGYSLNRSTPGSTCDCGHQACYHEPGKENVSFERNELEALKKKVDMLAAELEREKYPTRAELIGRIGRLEETVEVQKVEHDAELKNVQRGMSGLWQHVGILEKRTPYYDDHIEELVDDVQRLRDDYQKMDARVIEVDDATMRTEDRVDALEQASVNGPAISRRRKASTPPSPGLDDDPEESIKSEDDMTPSQAGDRLPRTFVLADEQALHIQSFRQRVSSVGSGAQSWTVHVSLLPSSSQPFPFEKDTAAYKRCLSRGLHQMIVVPDSDSTAFKNAVNAAFVKILSGRPWNPLVARLCDAKNLRGLPMLRQLSTYLIGSDYNYDFLQQNCAVNDDSGKILDLYIAMADDTISWADLKDIAPHTLGLEAAWTYDPYLDGPFQDDCRYESLDTSRPAAGDIVPAWSPSLKRNASEITRTSSFGSSADSDGSRAKIRCTGTTVEVLGRQAEAV
ncbi:hypothetical protein EG329_009796 [Mollisiaceae sp. DMI_Dod_QoI]|nr:hypothetical protein EG329_009796 [Helotiales sp. DMI_Dod_QoI]